jgi:hypothetical protein
MAQKNKNTIFDLANIFLLSKRMTPFLAHSDSPRLEDLEES